VPVLRPGFESWRRAMAASEEVERRARRFTAVLDAAGVPYAVIGGNAVAAWVGTIDKEAIRSTKDVDVLLRRGDLPKARQALEPAGFIFAETMDVPMFIDGPTGSAKSAVHILYAGEMVKPGDLAPSVDIADSERGADFQVLTLEALVRMKLISYRRKDQVHLEDMIGVGLIDETWPTRFAPELGARLQHILDTLGE
jgi:hypothetical protein